MRPNTYQRSGEMWFSPLLRQFAGLTHAVTGRAIGNMAVSRPAAGDAQQARVRVAEALGVDWQRVVFPAMRHGSDVATVNCADGNSLVVERLPDDAPRVMAAALSGGYDALVTGCTDVYLAICVADCAPVFLYDPVRRVVALVHAGLSGSATGVVHHTLLVMRERFGCAASDIRASIGPCISKRALEISNSRMWTDVLEPAGAMSALPPRTLTRIGGKLFFDIPACVEADLRDGGVLPDHVEASGACTFAQRHDFYSDYAAAAEGADSREAEGRLLALVGLTPPGA